MTLNAEALASRNATVTDIAQHHPQGVSRRNPRGPAPSVELSAVVAALHDDELLGEAKLLVACWTAAHVDRVHRRGDAGGPTILDAARMATGLRGGAALNWVASVVALDALRSDPALPRYIEADWQRLHRWASSHIAEVVERPPEQASEQPAGALDRVVPQVSRGDMLR